jgi:dihydroflavonol-4-reductase
MNILVTGATGFVGSIFIPMLLKTGRASAITLFCLPGERLPEGVAEDQVRVVRGDITNYESIRDAVRGHQEVYHIAGFISYWNRDKPKLLAVNVQGARNVARACAEAGVRRMVHVSSVGAVGFYRDDRLATEDTPFNWPDSFHYMTTKRDGELGVREVAKETGLDVVYVNPASIMGPGDPMQKSAHNQIYAKLVGHKRFFGSFTGGLAIVDVRDLSDLLIRAMEKGRAGERYLAVGANLRYADVLRGLGKHSGTKVHPIGIPSFLVTIGGAFAEFFSVFTKKRPLITIAYGRLSGWLGYYDASKSARELGVSYRDSDETFKDGVDFYQKRFCQK